MSPLPLAVVNELDQADFVRAFGGIAEHTPWVAERAASARPFAGRLAMIEAFQRAVADARPDERLALLGAHPDLAGRAARAGDLADSSRREQAGAGLDSLDDEEFARFHALNDRYRARFGFPFILAVRGAGKAEILSAFAARIDGGEPEERLTALAQVCRIIRLRIEEQVA